MKVYLFRAVSSRQKPANWLFILWPFILTWLLLFLYDINAPSNIIFASGFVRTKYFHQKHAIFNLHILQDEWGGVPHWLRKYLWNLFFNAFLWIKGFCDCTVPVRLLLANIRLNWQKCRNLKITVFLEVLWKCWADRMGTAQISACTESLW